MRILILDDDNERHDWFRDEFARDQRQHVWTVAEALWALSGPEGWDMVSLDHDLDLSHPALKVNGIHRPTYDIESHTGLSVAKYIASAVPAMPWCGTCRFVVHSWNPAGARLMYDAIASAGLAVFYEPWQWRNDRNWCRRWYERAWPNPAERPALPWEAAR